MSNRWHCSARKRNCNAAPGASCEPGATLATSDLPSAASKCTSVTSPRGSNRRAVPEIPTAPSWYTMPRPRSPGSRSFNRRVAYDDLTARRVDARLGHRLLHDLGGNAVLVSGTISNFTPVSSSHFLVKSGNELLRSQGIRQGQKSALDDLRRPPDRRQVLVQRQAMRSPA